MVERAYVADPSDTSGKAKAVGTSSGRPSQGATRSGPVAVAITDNEAGKRPPRILAKGQGKVAEQILEIAFARGVKVRTDANLAEVLAAIDVDSEVPLQALAAVAEILTYVYRANGALGADPAAPLEPKAVSPEGGAP